MDLDDLAAFRAMDGSSLLAEINALPDRLETAYEIGAAFPLPDCSIVTRMVLVGMGASISGADLFLGTYQEQLDLPVCLRQDENLPGWARGSSTLVVVIDHSGNSPEALSALRQATERGCPCLAVTSGGKLAEWARALGLVVWEYPVHPAARCAVPWVFGYLHCLLHRLGHLPNPGEELREGTHAMRNAQMSLLAEVPVVRNPAKRMAGQLIGRWAVIVGAGYLAPVARRWKILLGEMAKNWAQAETVPDADYHSIEGFANPERLLQSAMVLFLRAPDLGPRLVRRLDLTRELALRQGMNTDFIDARGHSRYGRIWTGVVFADYCAYFLAMAYGLDPSETAVLDYFRAEFLSDEG
jgi:glucose/mannose-6-phosphate isomerase